MDPNNPNYNPIEEEEHNMEDRNPDLLELTKIENGDKLNNNDIDAVLEGNEPLTPLHSILPNFEAQSPSYEPRRTHVEALTPNGAPPRIGSNPILHGETSNTSPDKGKGLMGNGERNN